MLAFSSRLHVSPAVALALAAPPSRAGEARRGAYLAGAVCADGTIVCGSGFTVRCTSANRYMVTVARASGFDRPPAISVAPWGFGKHRSSAILSAFTRASGQFEFGVMLHGGSLRAGPTDSGFMFTVTEN